MIVIDLEQGSEEWFQEKLGKPSASNANQIVTSQGKLSKQREGYLYTLAAERVTGKRADTYKNENMQVGNDREQESRDLYTLVTGEEIKTVGVVYKNDEKKFLCSPDGIIESKRCGFEVKNVLPKTQVKYLLTAKVPTEYIVQIQFGLYVTGFDRWEFCTYSPGLRPLIIHVNRDESLIMALHHELELFCAELDMITKKIS